MLRKSLFLLLVGMAAAAVFIYSGRYDISATTPHWKLVKTAISMTVDRSVKHHAKGIVAPELEDTAMVRLGFGHYREMCVECHGAPGVERSEFAEGLYPKAPKLKGAADEWTAAELYWMTKNGIKMSGMPAFGKTHSEHELWAIVAFLKKLPAMDSSAYAAYTAASPESE
ncbi:MAG: cytochrome c [Fibrobacteres bacterium]|nr:cytochrome c [Fibrobacterota bacterium]